MRVAKNLTTNLFAMIFVLNGLLTPSLAKAEYDYQLYKNYENFGILIFPKDQIFTELDEYIQQTGFSPVESGKAVMRFGPNNENQTYLMPESVQKKYSMDRFIVLQVLAHQNMVVGIFDPEWGLTLPSPIHRLDEIKENIPKTLNLFRKHLKKRETRRHTPGNLKIMRLSANNAVTIPMGSRFTSRPH